MAFRLAQEGRKATYRKGKGDIVVFARKINDDVVTVKRKEVASYLEDGEFQRAMYVYNQTKRWGLPNGGGWADEPEDIMECLNILETESNKIEQERLEEKHGKRTSNAKTSGIRSSGV